MWKFTQQFSSLFRTLKCCVNVTIKYQNIKKNQYPIIQSTEYTRVTGQTPTFLCMRLEWDVLYRQLIAIPFLKTISCRYSSIFLVRGCSVEFSDFNSAFRQ